MKIFGNMRISHIIIIFHSQEDELKINIYGYYIGTGI